MSKTQRFLNKPTRGKVPVLEHKIHQAIADYLNTVIKRPSRWHTVEVSNQASGRAAMLRQMALKRRGCITGWPDISIYHQTKCTSVCSNPICNSGELSIIFLEVKIPGGKLTEKQEALHQELREDGHFVSVVYSVDDVKKILKDLGISRLGR